MVQERSRAPACKKKKKACKPPGLKPFSGSPQAGGSWKEDFFARLLQGGWHHSKRQRKSRVRDRSHKKFHFSLEKKLLESSGKGNGAKWDSVTKEGKERLSFDPQSKMKKFEFGGRPRLMQTVSTTETLKTRKEKEKPHL